MVTLYEKYGALRDHFEVLAFHDGRVKDFAELDKKTKRVMEARWGGKPLPFPILLDATGTTVKTYGIRAFPTNILIDPQGRVVKGNAEQNLEKVLEELAEAATEKAGDSE